MTPSETDHRRDSLISSVTPVAMAFVGLVVIFVLGVAYNHGRTLQQETANAETAAIETEDAAFCATLGITQNSFLFARCRSGLADIRRAHQQRLASDAIGSF